MKNNLVRLAHHMVYEAGCLVRGVEEHRDNPAALDNGLRSIRECIDFAHDFLTQVEADLSPAVGLQQD